MKKSEETVAGFLAKKLKSHGVRYLFGIPGGPSIPLLHALNENGIEFIVTSHESAAAVMADVTARLTGITGVCHSTFGPGATNLSTGVGGALLDRSPLLALTSVVADEWRNRTTQMNIDHQTLFRALTKATYRLSPENTPGIIDEALFIANAEYPGPVHIAIPADISDKSVSTSVSTSKSATAFSIPSEKDLEKISHIIESSKRPLIAIGLTAARLGLGEKIGDFLKKKQIPFVVTPMAKGIIHHDHPCFAGVLFHALSGRLKPLIDEADLIIGFGYDPVEYNYESWIPDVQVIHFDTVKCDLPLSKCTQFISSTELWLKALDGLNGCEEMVSLAVNVRSSITKILSSRFQGFSPVEAIKILNDVLPENSIITADVGSHLHLLGQQWQASQKGRFIITNGWSSMGFGLPAALAAALCEPERPVVCITGDGGLIMSAGEIMTARRYGLKVVVIVFSDGELNLIKLKEVKRGVVPYGVDLYKGSLFCSNSFFGVKVLHADNPLSLKSSVDEALKATEPVIIEVSIDPAAYSQLIVT